MKKLIVSFVALLLLVGGTINVQGQTSKTAEERAKLQADNIKTVLVLNEEQSAKVYEIVLSTTKQKDSVISKNAGTDASTLLALLKSVTEAGNVKIKAILTPEQAIIFEAKKGELTGFTPTS